MTLEEILGITDPTVSGRMQREEMCPCGMLPTSACDGTCVEVTLERRDERTRTE